MNTRQGQRKIWFRLVTFIVIISFFCQNIAWAQRGVYNQNIAPKSIFENFDKYFISKGINLPFHVKSKIFLGFKEISERIFPLSPQREEELLQGNNLFKEITKIFSYCDSNFQEYLRFKPDTVNVITEDGNKSFSIDIELVQAKVLKTVVFYDPFRPPLKNLKKSCGTWTDEDEVYIKERGFWIVDSKVQPEDSQVLDINTALRILDNFLNQSTQKTPLEFVGFEWEDKCPSREFLQAHLQEILSLAMNGQIVVHQLPDRTIRFIKLQEFHSVRVDEDIVQKAVRLYDTRFPKEEVWVQTTEKGTFCPITMQDAVILMKDLNAKQGTKFIDLGSGDGRVAIMAKASGMDVTAYEYDKELFGIGLSMEREVFGKNGVIDFRNRDFMKDRSLNLSEYDVIYYFEAGTHSEEELYRKIKREMRDDAILVVFGDLLIFGDMEHALLSDLTSLGICYARIYSKSKRYPVQTPQKEAFEWNRKISLITKVIFAITLTIIYIGGYWVINYIVSGWDVGFTPSIWLDYLIPFTTVASVPYLLFIPILFSPVFFIKTCRHIIASSFAILYMLVGAFTTFLTTPVVVVRPVVSGTDFFSWLTNFIYSVDQPFNATPSLHVTMAVFSMLLTNHFNEKWGRILAIPAIIFSLSTLFLKQHYLIDVILGVVLGVLGFIIFKIFKKMMETETSLILHDSPLSYLGRELGVNFYVPQSAKKEGFWKYELDLTDEERRVLEKNDVVTGYIGDRPTRIYIVFYNERPLYIVWHDKGMAFGYGLSLELSEEMKGPAKEWLEADLKSSVIFMEQLFQYVVTDSEHRICCFKGVYGPSHDTSYIFQKGIRPKKGAKILVLGTGSAYDAILAAERGAGEVVATDKDSVSVACARFNIAQSKYRDRIKVYKADLFNIPDRPKYEKFSSIYFNLPLDSQSGDIRVSDKGMVLLERVLNEAKDHLEEGGTLEVTYEEIPAFFEKVYSKGWEPARIEGTLMVRQLMEGEPIFFDYGRFVLVRQKDRERRQDDLKKIISYWHELAEIKRLYDNHDASCIERLVKIRDVILEDFGKRSDFNVQLLIKGVNDLANYIFSILQKQPVSDPRVNKFYPEYMPSEGNGAMKRPSVYSSLDEDNLRIAKAMEPKWRKKADAISLETRIIKGKIIRVKFIDNARDLPEGMYAYHFYDENANLIIVNNTEFQEEAIYHEAREAYWQGKGLSRREAHILACAEQVLAFSEEGKLTKFHESQIGNMIPHQLGQLLNEYDLGSRKYYHHKLIQKHLGKNSYKLIEGYEKLFRMKVVLLLTKAGIKRGRFLPSERSRTMLIEGLGSCKNNELEELQRQVEEIEGCHIANYNKLRRILLNWFDIHQLGLALGLSDSPLRQRTEVGDIKSFVSVRGHKMFHPIKAMQEYIYYEENKRQIVAERYLRSAIESLSITRFKQLVGFIGEETGISVQAGITDEVIEQVFSICKTWFTVHSLCGHLGVSKNTVNRIIRKWNLKTFTIGPQRGKKITLISPRSIAMVEGLLKELLDDIKIWYRKNFGEEIELSTLDDLKTWIGLTDFLKIFPFIKRDSIRNIPSISIYKVKYKYFTPFEYYIPPIVVERLRNEVVSWIRRRSVFEVIKKHGLVQPDSLPEDLDYDKAKEIILRIINEWLTIEQFAEKAGLGEDTVRHLIKRNEIDYIKLGEFTAQFTYYIPPGSIQKLKDRDREALERGKQFLESICGVAVPSLDDVRSLLSRHCVTSSQIAEQLGIPRIMHTSQRPNTVVLNFTRDTSPIVYWRKEDASAFIENERRKFEELKAEVGRYSDVSQIGTPKELIALLKREWKRPYQLAKERGVFYSKIMRDVYQGKLPSVTINLVGYRKHVYIYPLNISKLEKIVKKLREFNSEWTRLGSAAQRTQNISRIQFAVPVNVLKSAGDFTLALKKMRMLGGGNTIFELIVYDLDEDIDGDRLIKLLELPSNIRIYAVTKKEAGDTLQLKGVIQNRYPLGEDDYLMIATDIVDKDKAMELKERLGAVKDERVSFGVVVKPDETSVISLSRILTELLGGMGKGLSVKIILPLPISPREIKKRLEEEVAALWEFLSAA